MAELRRSHSSARAWTGGVSGAPGANSGAGEVVIFFGLPDPSIWELQYPHNGAIHIESPTAGTRLGAAVAGGEFLASKANDEVIACAPGWDGPGNLGEGGLLIWGEVNNGPALDIGSADMGFVGEQSLCTALIVAPDLDGTGNPDLIVGDANVQDPTGEPFGAIYVVDGDDGVFPVRRIESVATRVIRGDGNTRVLGARLIQAEARFFACFVLPPARFWIIRVML